MLESRRPPAFRSDSAHLVARAGGGGSKGFFWRPVSQFSERDRYFLHSAAPFPSLPLPPDVRRGPECHIAPWNAPTFPSKRLGARSR
jgi:hypothetical protein